MTEPNRPVWGKAGVRLSPQEADAVRARRRAKAAESARLAKLYTDRARAAYNAGQLRPFTITLALDLAGLHGPEVDVACGAAEPDVDRWEAGDLYPTWDQLLALARLCDLSSPWFFFVPRDPPIAADETSMRFHLPPSQLADHKPAVLTFTDKALRRAGITLTRG